MHVLLAFAFALRLGAPNAEPALREPQLAANSKLVALTYGADGQIFFRRSGDRGKTFSAPVRVATANVVPLNRHRGPRLVLAGNSIIISAVVGRTLATGPHAHGLPMDGDLCVWRSEDQGKSWSACIRVNDFLGAPTEGLHTLAASADGKLFAAWLDKRGAQGLGDAVRLYGAQSTDGGRTWATNTKLYESPDGTICQCCHPSAAFDGGGRLWVMFRNAVGGARDMYLVNSVDGTSFSAAAKAGQGTWKLNACPMDGGGISVQPDGVHTAWRREKQIYLARPGQPEVMLGEGIDVSLSGAYLVWTTPQGIAALGPRAASPLLLSADGAFPNVVSLPEGGALAAWESKGQIVIRPIGR
jgi:hypothetical protein